MQQSEELSAFYKAIWEWAHDQNNAAQAYGEIFSHDHGLCSNLYRYAKHMHPHKVEELEVELKQQFEDAFKGIPINLDCPFNATGSEYDEESNKYLNPKRLEWIEDHLPG